MISIRRPRGSSDSPYQPWLLRRLKRCLKQHGKVCSFRLVQSGEQSLSSLLFKAPACATQVRIASHKVGLFVDQGIVLSFTFLTSFFQHAGFNGTQLHLVALKRRQLTFE